jgi:hypothetical protein
MKNYIVIAVTSIASSIATLMVAGVCMVIFIIQPFQKQAVDRGFASWEVTDNATGSTKFTWNELATAVHNPNPDMFAQIEQPLE